MIMIRHSIKTGFSFGITSGIITTLGLIAGLNAGTHSQPVVIGGVLTIAIADAFSDAFGIHISEESENKHSNKELWESTLATFISKFVIALTFIIPLLLLELSTAIIVSMAWGLTLLGAVSYYLAKEQTGKTWNVVIEHIIIAVLVIILTHFTGEWIGNVFL